MFLFFLVQEFIDNNVMATAGGFICKPCNKFMKFKNSIRRHAEQTHINVGFIYQCPLCKSEKNTKNALQLHVYKEHPELKGMDFDQCQINEQY
jgi:hypothetical protein